MDGLVSWVTWLLMSVSLRLQNWTCWSRCACPCCTNQCRPISSPSWPACCRRDRIVAAFKGIWTQEFWHCVGVEFLAMIVFVLLRLGSNINWVAEEEHPPHPDLVLISLCFGLSIATLVKCFGHISGAHINPAVTAAMVVTRRLSLAKAVFYLLPQRLGAVVGAAVLYGMGITSLPYTDASMNPAQSFGPAMVTWSWDNHWVYWVDPGLGGVIASALYEYLFCPDPELKRRSAEVLSKTGFPSTKYREVQSSFTADRDQLVNELPFTVMDVDRAKRKEREMEWERGTSGGVLVCMTSEVHW